MRGQASLEMLLTYGWMMLLLLIAVVLLYNLGFFSVLESVVPKQNQAVGLATFSVDSRIASNGEATLNVLNNGGGSVTIDYIKINEAFVGEPFPALPFLLGQGDLIEFSCSTNLNGSVGSAFKNVGIELGFSTNYYEDHVDSGIINGVYAPSD